MSCIYKVTNNINGKVYIGQTVRTPRDRWRQHVQDAYNESKCLHLCAAILKYGEENFTVEAIEFCPQDQLDEREIYWIKQYNSQEEGYNITAGGKGTNKEVPQELLEQLWDSGLSTDEIAQQVGFTRQWVRQRLKPYKNYSAEEGKRRGAKLISKGKGHAVLQLNLDGTVVNEYPSIKIATETTGINNISRSCIKGTTAGGYRWQYKE